MLNNRILINTVVDLKKKPVDFVKKTLCFPNGNIKKCFDLYPVMSPNPLHLTDNLKLQISQKYR